MNTSIYLFGSPYFNLSGSRFSQYQGTAASKDDRLKSREDLGGQCCLLSAGRVQGQLAGLNRHEVADDDDPRRLIVVRRVARRPTASPRGKAQRVLPDPRPGRRSPRQRPNPLADVLPVHAPVAHLRRLPSQSRDFTVADSARSGKSRDRTSSVAAATLVPGRGNVW